MHTQNLMEAMCYNLYRSPRKIAFNFKKKKGKTVEIVLFCI